MMFHFFFLLILTTFSSSSFAKNFENEVSGYLDFLGFTDLADLKSSTQTKNLEVISSGFCLGGTFGRSNLQYHVFTDSCLFYGEASVLSGINDNSFRQAHFKTYGLKIAPGGGVFISDRKLEFGLKLPVLLLHQENPTYVNDDFFDDSILQRKKGTKFFTSLYSRWEINQALIQIELGKEISNETTVWSLGAGHRF
jgi:hypothetical protein